MVPDALWLEIVMCQLIISALIILAVYEYVYSWIVL